MDPNKRHSFMIERHNNNKKTTESARNKISVLGGVICAQAFASPDK